MNYTNEKILLETLQERDEMIHSLMLKNQRLMWQIVQLEAKYRDDRTPPEPDAMQPARYRQKQPDQEQNFEGL